MTIEQRITGLYSALLGRAPDIEGFDFWVTKMKAGVPFRTVLDCFIASPEFQKMEVSSNA